MEGLDAVELFLVSGPLLNRDGPDEGRWGRGGGVKTRPVVSANKGHAAPSTVRVHNSLPARWLR